MASPPPLSPRIRVAPAVELRIYNVHEHQLDALAQGARGTISLSFALALLPISATLLVTLLTVAISSDRTFAVFVSACIISFVAGLICLVHGLRSYRGTRALVDEIKRQMPPAEGVQET